MNLVELNNVTLKAGKTALLRDINLKIPGGEFTGILGPNGAGKSSLLNLINGTLRPDSGELRLFDQPVKSYSEGFMSRLRKKIAFVPQKCDFNRLFPLTAAETVAIARTGNKRFFESSGENDRQIVEQSLEKLRITHLADRTFRSLSGGERQKVQLARALAQEPELLLLDEPTTGLDMEWQERLVSLIDQLFRRSGITVLMTTHITGHLPSCCKRVIMLKQGQIIDDAPTEEALSSEKLEKLYGCRVEVVDYEGRKFCFGAGIKD